MKTIRASVVAAFAVCLLCCGYGDCVRAASQAVAEFHHKYNEQDFAVLWRMADAGTLRRHISERDAHELLRVLFAEMGAEVRAVESASRCYYGLDANRVRVEYRTTFERGVQVERFLFQIRDGRVTLLAYEVRKVE